VWRRYAIQQWFYVSRVHVHSAMNRSPYHLGFCTLDRETSLDDLPVRGTIPPWLTGTLVRTGPAKFEVGNGGYNHWFDGLAMLHKFAFTGGRVAYANRYLRSRSYLEATATGKISRGEFATDPCRTLFQRVASWFWPKFTDNCNVNVNKLADEIVTYTETRMPIRFDPDTLNTLGEYDYDEQIKGPVSIAHPHLDHARGRHYTYVLEFGRRSKYHIFGIDQATGREAVVATIAAERPAYIHSFGMSQRYLVLAEFPLVVNPLWLKFSGKPFIRNYRWQPDRGVRFHIVHKETGQVARTARSRAVFAFHHVNAFEEGDEVVVDIVAFPDSGVIDQFYLERLRSAEPVMATGKLTRFRIGSRGDSRDERLSEAAIEVPRINYRCCAGRPYRYVYGAGNEVRGNFIDNLVKLDLEHKAISSWYEEGCYPGEPVFVSTPRAANEDDGVILSVVLDANKAASFLLILDASSFRELARAEVSHHIPFGFHGNYFAEISGPESFRELHR
jgi:beta,beta-carotene 9',10'-dioxygenase